jgi:hypothetical protein
MIQPRDLRVNNNLLYYIGEEGIEWEVTTIDSQDIDFCQIKHKEFNDSHKPIPLSEEELVKLGFEEFDGYWSKDDIDVVIHGDKFPIRIWGGESAPHLSIYMAHHTQYVHQLQNLFHALTGKEITYTP